MIRRALTRIAVAVLGFAVFELSLAVTSETLLQRYSELISSPNVALDLKLNQSQASERDKLFAEYQADREPLVARIQAAPENQRDALTAQLDQLTEALDSKLLALLSVTQQARLMQIGVQQEGSVALADEAVSREVGLSHEQRTKIAAILAVVEKAQADYQAALGEAIARIPEPESGKAAMQAYDAKAKAVTESMKPRFNQFLAVKTAGNRQIYALLNPAQRKKWEALHGKPLKAG